MGQQQALQGEDAAPNNAQVLGSYAPTRNEVAFPSGDRLSRPILPPSGIPLQNGHVTGGPIAPTHLAFLVYAPRAIPTFATSPTLVDHPSSITRRAHLPRSTILTLTART